MLLCVICVILPSPCPLQLGDIGDIGTESSVGGRAGDGVFFVWSSGAQSESMFPGEYFVSIFAIGLGGYYPGWPMSGGMA